MEAHALLKQHGFQVICMLLSGHKLPGDVYAFVRTHTYAIKFSDCKNVIARVLNGFSYRHSTSHGHLQVSSYGTNGHVKLPGTSQREPNVYDFGTPYAEIYEDLRQKDEAFYSRKGLLQVQTSHCTAACILMSLDSLFMGMPWMLYNQCGAAGHIPLACADAAAQHGSEKGARAVAGQQRCIRCCGHF